MNTATTSAALKSATESTVHTLSGTLSGLSNLIEDAQTRVEHFASQINIPTVTLPVPTRGRRMARRRSTLRQGSMMSTPLLTGSVLVALLAGFILVRARRRAATSGVGMEPERSDVRSFDEGRTHDAGGPTDKVA